MAMPPLLSESAAHTSVDVARLLLNTASLAGADARKLAADAELPTWGLSAGARMIPARLTARVWELLEQILDDPQAGLTVAGLRAFGDFRLYDYLITTSATLRDAMRAASKYLHLVTTAGRMGVAAETWQSTTYAYRCPEVASRGEELCVQFALAAICAGARAVTEQWIVPARVTFPQPQPRFPAAFVAVFGTNQIDFGAPAATIAYRNQDLDLPLPTADPMLAEILARYAAIFPAPEPVTWFERFQQVVGAALDASSASLSEVAHDLTMSPRTLQRRLADHGTTWRAELDAARRRRVKSTAPYVITDAAALARRLGYADPRSARRAVRRWGDEAER
jgi:AraC-like DNA-binding protein